MKIRSVDFLGSLIGCARKELYYSYLIQMFICFKWIRINCLLAHKKSIFFFLVCVASLRKSLVSWRGYNVVLPRHSDTIRMRRWHVLNNDADKKKTKKKKTKHVLEHTVTFRENYCCYSLFIISVHFLTAVFLGFSPIFDCLLGSVPHPTNNNTAVIFIFQMETTWNMTSHFSWLSTCCVCVEETETSRLFNWHEREKKSFSPPYQRILFFFVCL
jgi:hypothetical protein